MANSCLGSLSLLLILFVSLSSANPNTSSDKFQSCFSSLSHDHNNLSQTILTKHSLSYLPVLQSTIQNLRFINITNPQLILTPLHVSHIQAAIICSKKVGFHVRIRSGGHDYEGLSYVSNGLFIIIDLLNFQSINVDIKTETAWVQSGATLGQLYYKIADKSKIHGFPAGSCSTVGVGGHFSGGGFGTIFRKFGLASDNVIDAKMVAANGAILDRKSMGEDLFWAIRGGGGANFGVIFSWKIRLVRVPATVTVFDIAKTIEENGNKLLSKWQQVADKLPEDLFLHAVIGVTDSSQNNGTKTISISFGSLFLGGIEKLLPLMQHKFPELGVNRSHCIEMNWIQSVLKFSGFSIDDPLTVLINRIQPSKSFSKAKSDYVTEPISEIGIEGLWQRLIGNGKSYLILTPYGGKMNEISDSETPFPHRRGNLYKIQYVVTWEASNETDKHIDWIRNLYKYMASYVSKSPRAAYINYRDLDLGRNKNEKTSYGEASEWGLKYFKDNFKRLVDVKSAIDPHNFFWDEQSLPVVSHPRK